MHDHASLRATDTVASRCEERLAIAIPQGLTLAVCRMVALSGHFFAWPACRQASLSRRPPTVNRHALTGLLDLRSKRHLDFQCGREHVTTIQFWRSTMKLETVDSESNKTWWRLRHCLRQVRDWSGDSPYSPLLSLSLLLVVGVVVKTLH